MSNTTIAKHEWVHVYDQNGNRIVCQKCGAQYARDWIVCGSNWKPTAKLTLLDSPLFTNRWDTGVVDR